MSWPRSWRETTVLTRLLGSAVPLYNYLSQRRQKHLLERRQALPVPLVVVGNLVVGGTGKTPFIAWLTQSLLSRGCQVGLVSRGHGGRARAPELVTTETATERVGDEPVLLAARTGVPVCVGVDRLQAARHLLRTHPALDVILSDDGLQHLSLPRDLSLCLFDGQAGMGNGRLLPAGPLREPLARAFDCDMVLCKGDGPGAEQLRQTGLNPHILAMRLEAPINLRTGEAYQASEQVAAGGQRPLALCGIGQPESFFSMLTQYCPDFERLTLADHGRLHPRQLERWRHRPLLMTEKDAVKLPRDHGLQQAYVARLTLVPPAAVTNRLLQQITHGIDRHSAGTHERNCRHGDN